MKLLRMKSVVCGLSWWIDNTLPTGGDIAHDLYSGSTLWGQVDDQNHWGRLIIIWHTHSVSGHTTVRFVVRSCRCSFGPSDIRGSLSFYVPVCCPTAWLELNVTSFHVVSDGSAGSLRVSVCLPSLCSCERIIECKEFKVAMWLESACGSCVPQG